MTHEADARAADWLCREEGHHWVWTHGPHVPSQVERVGYCSTCKTPTVELFVDTAGTATSRADDRNVTLALWDGSAWRTYRMSESVAAATADHLSSVARARPNRPKGHRRA